MAASLDLLENEERYTCPTQHCYNLELSVLIGVLRPLQFKLVTLISPPTTGGRSQENEIFTI